jgi:molybdenum cofactor biosynthesis protein B
VTAKQAREFVPLRVAVLVVSDSRSEKTDKSGALLVERLTTAGHTLSGKRIVPDDIHRIRAAVAAWCADPEVDVVLSTGGTGVTGRDGTPEAVSVLFDKEIAGFGELFRMLSYEEIGTSSLQSRAVAGVANGTYIFCIPGSSGACATAWDRIISAQLDFRTRPCNLVELMPRLKEK